MRLPFLLKTLLGILLPLLLAAGCAAPLGTPSFEPGTVQIAVRIPKSGFQTQHKLTDIATLVVGLVDVSENPYFGKVGNADLDPASHAFHEVIAGSAGVSGLLSNLGVADPTNPKRFLYAMTTDRDALALSFGNVRPSSTPRYVAFAVAFNRTGAVTKEDVIGFYQQSAPFSVPASGTTVNLPMTLSYGLGSLRVVTNFITSSTQVNQTQSVVVALLDASSRIPSFGYLDNEPMAGNVPNYHVTIVGNLVNGVWQDGDFKFTGTPIDGDAQAKMDWKRVLYYTIPTGPTATNGSRAVNFENLKEGGYYYAFAVAFNNAEQEMGYASVGPITISRKDPKIPTQIANLTVTLHD